MKRILPFVLLLVLSSSGVLAHGGNDHVRGTVTEMTATSITVPAGPPAAFTATRPPESV